MENKQSEIILDRILKNLLQEQKTGLVFVGNPKDKKKKQQKKDTVSTVAKYARWYWILIGLGAIAAKVGILRILYKRFLKKGGASVEAAFSKMPMIEILKFNKDLSSPEGLNKFKRITEGKFMAGKITQAERNAIFNTLDDPQLLGLIRGYVFNDIFNKFKRGKISAEELIAHLDTRTARESGDILRQMERDGTGGIQGKVGKEVKANLTPSSTVKLPPVYNAESFNKVINQADKAGILEKIYGKEAVTAWKTKQTGLLNFDIKQLDHLLSFDKPGAFVFKTEVKNLTQYKELLKQHKMYIPTDPTEMTKKWKFYQLKQIFAQSKY